MGLSFASHIPNFPFSMKALFVLIFISAPVFSQSTFFDEIQFQRNLSDLRGRIYQENPDQIRRMNEIWNFWASSGVDSDEIKALLVDLLRYNDYSGVFRKSLISRNLKDYLTLPLVDEYFALEEINDLFKEEILNIKPPFVLVPNSELITELKFYKLKRGDEIAEIGAGKGMFSIYLALTGLNLNISINELKNLERIEKTLKTHEGNLVVDKIEIIQGKKTSARLESKKDAILIRNSFHHFKKMKAMLADLKNSLKPGGRLYIMEYQDGLCKDHLDQDLITRIITRNGWRLSEEKLIGDKFVQEYYPITARGTSK